MSHMDEDETVEIVSFGSGEVHIHTGLDHAMARARSDYIAGRTEADEFEAETERLLRKRADLNGGAA
jgi:hypothetical protein